jgi:spore coat polysaccharide biosynthesis protein SpsF (cytidylyltransferase family)
VIATTTDSSDNRLCDYVRERGWGLYRGSSEDILQRLWAAATASGFDVVVEVDGDDLLCASEYMDLGVEILLAGEFDWVTFQGLPLGVTPNILRTTALAIAVERKSYTDTSSGIFSFLSESGLFRVLKAAIQHPAHQHSSARMTLDYPQDALFFSETYRLLDNNGEEWDLRGVVHLLNSRPDIVALNQGLEGRYWAHFQEGVARRTRGAQ